MGMEIEAKMKVEDHAVIRQRLMAANAQSLGDHFEKNVFFDTRDRSLLSADKGLRLRLNRKVQTGQEECRITFKGPQQKGALKSREEIETTVGDFSEMAALLEQLGYARGLTFEKRRQSWKLGKCKVELDELPILGLFVEIEGPDESAVLTVREQLQLMDRPPITTSYIAMLMNHLKEKQDASTEVVFPHETTA